MKYVPQKTSPNHKLKKVWMSALTLDTRFRRVDIIFYICKLAFGEQSNSFHFLLAILLVSSK